MKTKLRKSMGIEKRPQVQQEIKLREDAARRGKDAAFKGWWFFDTNCISELIKLSRIGFREKVCKLISNQDILISSSNYQELRRRPDILQDLEDTLCCANLFFVPDITRFWYTDIINFLFLDGLKMNTLQVFPFMKGFTTQLINSQEFDAACKEGESHANKWLLKITPDIGAPMDERDLRLIIWHKVNHLSNEWFKINISQAECNSMNFPSFFVYYYTYYYRYIKNPTAKPELNDFIDLKNCIAAPYCQRYYAEEKFTNILRLSLKGRETSTAFQMLKRVYKKGLIDYIKFQNEKRNMGELEISEKLLSHTEIYNFSEMVEQIKNY